MLDFHVLTIFPEMFESFIGASILKRAIEAGLVRVGTHDFREFTQDKHRRVDDYPFGGRSRYADCGAERGGLYGKPARKARDNLSISI